MRPNIHIFAVRLQLINSVLIALHSYWASIFVLLQSLINKAEAIFQNLLWSQSADYRTPPPKKKRACDIICKPKGAGGLGVKDCKKWNKAAIAKCL